MTVYSVIQTKLQVYLFCTNKNRSRQITAGAKLKWHSEASLAFLTTPVIRQTVLIVKKVPFFEEYCSILVIANGLQAQLLVVYMIFKCLSISR